MTFGYLKNYRLMIEKSENELMQANESVCWCGRKGTWTESITHYRMTWHLLLTRYQPSPHLRSIHTSPRALLVYTKFFI